MGRDGGFENDGHRKRGTFEQHFHSVVLTAVLAGVGWTLTTLIGLTQSMSAIRQHIETIDVQVSAAYRSSDAKRDVQEITMRMDAEAKNDQAQQHQLDNHERRITALERREHIRPQPTVNDDSE